MNAFHFLSHSNVQPPQIEFDQMQPSIRSLKPFNALGPDAIKNILLKNLPKSAILWITNLFNKCINMSYRPQNFKIAKVVPILKAGKQATDPNSYRPISLLNAVGKLFEKIVYIRLIKHIEEKSLLPNFQFGFRRGHTTYSNDSI